MPEEMAEELVNLLGCDHEETILASGKTGEGVEQILEAIVERINPLTGNPDGPLQCLIF